MSYTVLARKYRPQTFADLVGQEHISRTLANAIGVGRVAHAFLFTGARGVGKTTTARLLAKALNCELGPSATPCNQCDACREIAAGNDLDVLEIDGASNNSVDDVRRLQESLPFRPARDRFKIVIVDEVHMLSTGAFNAFLKTLEEPPPHVKFVFATTEIHKVPITIRSRCQRYDFRLIPRSVVADRVKAILAQEGITADDEAIAIVVREAEGSMRDALTVLDQLVAFGHDGLKGEEVARGLGIANRRSLHTTAQALLAGEAGTCLESVGALAAQGLDMAHFARQLVMFSRDLVVLRVLGEHSELVERPEDERQEAARIAQAHPSQHLERTFAGLAKLVEEIGESSNPQLTLEMGLVRLADRPPLEPLTDLLKRLLALEQRLGGASSGGGGGGGTPGPGRDPSAGGRGGPRRPPGSAQAPRELRAPVRLDARGPRGDEAADGESAPTQPFTAIPAAASVVAAGYTAPFTVAEVPAVSAAPAAPLTSAAPVASAAPAASAAAVSAAAPATSAAPVASAAPAASAAAVSAAAPASAGSVAAATPVAVAAPVASHARTAPVATTATAMVAAPVRLPVPVAASASAPAEVVAPTAVAARIATPSVAAAAIMAPGVPAAADARSPALATSAPEPSALAAGVNIPDAWRAIIADLREGQPALGAVLEHGVPTEIGPGKVVLTFPEGSFFGRQANSATARQLLAQVAERTLAARPAIEIRFGSVQPQSSLAAEEAALRQRKRAHTVEAALNHPRVRDAMDVFPETEGNVDVQVEEPK